MGMVRVSQVINYQKKSNQLLNRRIMIWHILTWDEYLPYPGCTSSNAKQLLKKYPMFDCIVTGDNHNPLSQNIKADCLLMLVV